MLKIFTFRFEPDDPGHIWHNVILMWRTWYPNNFSQENKTKQNKTKQKYEISH